jgi:hypothetical protein
VLLVVAILLVALFAISGLWTIAGAVFVLGVTAMVMVRIVQTVDGTWPRTWWPRLHCSQCGRRGHAFWECDRSRMSSPEQATFNRHGPGPKISDDPDAQESSQIDSPAVGSTSSASGVATSPGV